MCTFLNYCTYANGLRQNLQIRQRQGLGRKTHCTLVLEHKAKVRLKYKPPHQHCGAHPLCPLGCVTLITTIAKWSDNLLNYRRGHVWLNPKTMQATGVMPDLLGSHTQRYTTILSATLHVSSIAGLSDESIICYPSTQALSSRERGNEPGDEANNAVTAVLKYVWW